MRRALVVGINDYPQAPLHGCISDATQMEIVLEKHGDGSPNFQVKRLTSDETQITRGSLKTSIRRLFADRVETALLYFSGHGFINALGGYLVTPDFMRGDEGISMDEILNMANQSNATDKIIILDCCYSGAFGSPTITEGKIAQIAEGVTVLTASRGDESAVEQEGEGVFTSLLVDALQGGASDLRGSITPGSLYAYVDEALGAWDQRPIFKTNVSRFTELRKVTPPIPVEVLRRITHHFAVPAEVFRLDPSYEYTTGGAIEEHTAVFKDLQKYESVGLVKPVDEEHMYWAAINSTGCRLTAIGYQYWRLVKEGRI
ncbi:caspase family protein [Alicyclobacillus sp. SO9]|uniref:caspase family protein n=1 Tax=Alicyclobacillus sp. SO9 TaxID=2665646 RepID=UPI0018E7F7EC|nr:caspase family protein [Alicyclobacillus sp. SO9]QQE77762.1 caspase family protein [Alicyclobacillus sp. SO9]